MDVPHILRTARRRAGMSQRAFAARADVPASTLAAWESGHRRIPTHTLDRLLASVGLDLELCPRSPNAEQPDLVQHLHRSLTERLEVSLGVQWTGPRSRPSPLWRSVCAVARVGTAVIQPPVAIGLWVPIPVAQHVHLILYDAHSEIPTTEGLTVQVSADPPPAGLVPVGLDWRARVWVLPPGELARTLPAASLLRAEAWLADEAPVDQALRRRPPHRDPDERWEAERVLHTKGTENLVLPSQTDSRAWRLGAPASLAQALAWAGRLPR